MQNPPLLGVDFEMYLDKLETIYSIGKGKEGGERADIKVLLAAAHVPQRRLGVGAGNLARAMPW
jgi:hypothetical protein